MTHGSIIIQHDTRAQLPAESSKTGRWLHPLDLFHAGHLPGMKNNAQCLTWQGDLSGWNDEITVFGKVIGQNEKQEHPFPPKMMFSTMHETPRIASSKVSL